MKEKAETKNRFLFTLSKSLNKIANEGVDEVDTLCQNQDFDKLKQMYKQMSSGGINALKLTVFLGGNEFPLRSSVGKRFVFQAFPLLENNFCVHNGFKWMVSSFEAFFVRNGKLFRF